MNQSKLNFDRREFLLALAAGVSMLGCDDAESIDFRAKPNPPPNAQLPGVSIQVKSALSSQTWRGDEQACSIPTAMTTIAVGDQIRVTRNDLEYALYTVAEKRSQDNPNVVRMGQNARLRLGTSRDFAAGLTIPVVNLTLSDAAAEAASEFVERLDYDPNKPKHKWLCIAAPHGGVIELKTHLQAEAIAAALGCSSWICKGWKQGGGAFERWHITSTKISPNSFPGLKTIENSQFTHCVSIHGMSSGGVLIGGGAPLDVREIFREMIAAQLSNTTIAVDIAEPGDEFDGDSESNLVNWLTADGFGGVQIEQGREVRLEHWEEVVQGVIDACWELDPP